MSCIILLVLRVNWKEICKLKLHLKAYLRNVQNLGFEHFKAHIVPLF